MDVGPRRLCPRCACVVAVQDSRCRRCGLELRGGVEHARADRFEVVFRVVHAVAGVLALLVSIYARGSDLEFLGQTVLAVVTVSFAVHYRRRPQYPGIKARRRTRRLKRKRVAVFASAGSPLSRKTVRILGAVAWVAESRLDEIIVRAESAVITTGNERSDLLALVPVEPGDMFTTLLDASRMSVEIWLLDPHFLSVRRINVRARRRLRPSLSLGPGVVLVTNSQPMREASGSPPQRRKGLVPPNPMSVRASPPSVGVVNRGSEPETVAQEFEGHVSLGGEGVRLDRSGPNR